MITYFTGTINDIVDIYDLPDINLMLHELSHGLVVVDSDDLANFAIFTKTHIVLARDKEDLGEKGLIKESGKIVGMVLVNFLRKWGGSYAFVDDVIVRKEYRGKQYGIADKLMVLVDDLALKFSAKYTDLTCGNKPERTTAHRLYRRHGYVTRNSTPYRKRYLK